MPNLTIIRAGQTPKVVQFDGEMTLNEGFRKAGLPLPGAGTLKVNGVRPIEGSATVSQDTTVYHDAAVKGALTEAQAKAICEARA